MIAVFGIVGFLVNKYRFHVLGSESYLMIIVPVLLLITFHLNGRQIFEYDSDGEALHFKTGISFPF